MKRLSILLCFLIITFLINAQSIKSDGSLVKFKVSNMKWKSVEGTFAGMDGKVIFDAQNLSDANFDVSIDPATVNTENEKRDNHLRNEDFFHVEKYPKIGFKSTSIIKTAKAYKAIGNLTMHGITKPVEINFTYSNNSLVGKLLVNRFDYEIGTDTGTFMVGDEIELEILCKLL